MAKAKPKTKRKAPKKLTKTVRRPDRAGPQVRTKAGKYVEKNREGFKPAPLEPNKEWEREIEEKIGRKRQPHSSEPYLNLAAAIMQKPISPPEEKKEISVRSIYYDGQHLPALCFRTQRNLVPCLCGNHIEGIRLFDIDLATHDRAALVMHGPSGLRTPYPVDRFLAHMNKLVADGAPISDGALQALGRALHPFPVARPHAIAAATDAADRLPATGRRPDAENAPTKPVQPPVARLTPNRTDGKELIRELSRVSGLPPEKVRAKLRASGLRAPYTDPAACRKAMAVPDEPKQPRKKK